MDDTYEPKPVLEFNIKGEFEDNFYNIFLTQKFDYCEYLVIKIDQTNSIPHSSYEAELTKKDLDIASRYFRMFNDISQLFPELQNKFEKKQYDIKKNENSLLLFFYIGKNDTPEFFLTIPKIHNLIDSTVDGLCRLVNKLSTENKKMQEEIKTLKEEINLLKKDVKIMTEESDIVSDIVKSKDEKTMLFNWIKSGAKMKFILLYKAKRDGDRIPVFGEKVKGKSPTLVLVETKAGYRFGGYTTVDWSTTGSYKYKKDEHAFIFSINNKQKFSVIEKNVKYAICADPNHFAFGGGHDFTLWDHFFTNDNSKDYKCGFSYGTTSNFELTGGAKQFYVEECEVFQVIFG